MPGKATIPFRGPSLSGRSRAIRYLARAIFIMALVLTSLYATSCVAYYVFQERFLYVPSGTISSDPSDLGIAFEEVWINSSDGITLYGWWVPSEASDMTILLCHGNRGNIARYLDRVEIFHGMGLNILTFDYRGYGHSGGTPMEEGTYRDAEAAYGYLVNERNVSPDHLVVLGRSLGGAMGARLAREHVPAALILESTFTSYKAAAYDLVPFMPVGLLARIGYRTIDDVRELECPLLVIHSTDDTVIRYHNGRELYDAAPGSKEFLKISGTHGHGYVSSDTVYTGGVRGFLERHTTYNVSVPAAV